MLVKRKQNEVVHQTVIDYIRAQPAVVQPALEKLREAIRSAAPEAEEVISYRIPTYKLKGPLVHFAVHADHCSFIVIDRSIIEKFKKELRGFKTSGTTIHFTPVKPLPSSLIKKIVRLRIKANLQKTAGKAES
jgi:uncharacterized protein YdhG (YjbR/CyaY superfamily)